MRGVFKSAIWCTFFVIAALSFYGGLGLGRGSDWSAVSGAKAILRITGPIASIVLSVFLPIMIFGNTEAVAFSQFVGGA